MKNLKHIHHPKNLEEALNLLSSGVGVYPAAGCCSLSLSGGTKINELVNINNIGLNNIEETKTRYVIGAAVTAQNIIDSKNLSGLTGKLLKDCALTIGSRQIRNAVTLGGNICGLLPWSDFPPVLLALNAHIHIKSAAAETEHSADAFFFKHPAKLLSPGEICAHILFPTIDKHHRGAFMKFARTSVDKTIMNACLAFNARGNRISELKIAVSGCVGLPRRLTELETLLNGEIIDKNLNKKITAACLKIKNSVDFIGDLKAPKEYRRDIFEVIIRDAFERAVNCAHDYTDYTFPLPEGIGLG